MKIVIDTNIFISSFFWGGNPKEVFERVVNGLDELIITDEILHEIAVVMSSSKFSLEKSEIDDYVKIIERFSRKIKSVNKLVFSSRDPDDDKILKCAISGDVDFIITGDKDLLVIKEYETIKIMKPKDYLELLTSP